MQISSDRQCEREYLLTPTCIGTGGPCTLSFYSAIGMMNLIASSPDYNQKLRVYCPPESDGMWANVVGDTLQLVNVQSMEASS